VKSMDTHLWTHRSQTTYLSRQSAESGPISLSVRGSTAPSGRAGARMTIADMCSIEMVLASPRDLIVKIYRSSCRGGPQTMAYEEEESVCNREKGSSMIRSSEQSYLSAFAALRTAYRPLRVWTLTSPLFLVCDAAHQRLPPSSLFAQKVIIGGLGYTQLLILPSFLYYPKYQQCVAAFP